MNIGIPVANMVSISYFQLPRSNKLCPSCGETEAVFFQSQQRSAETGMVGLFSCYSPEIAPKRLTNYLQSETLLRLLRLR